MVIHRVIRVPELDISEALQVGHTHQKTLRTRFHSLIVDSK